MKFSKRLWANSFAFYYLRRRRHRHHHHRHHNRHHHPLIPSRVLFSHTLKSVAERKGVHASCPIVWPRIRWDPYHKIRIAYHKFIVFEVDLLLSYHYRSPCMLEKSGWIGDVRIKRAEPLHSSFIYKAHHWIYTICLSNFIVLDLIASSTDYRLPQALYLASCYQTFVILTQSPRLTFITQRCYDYCAELQSYRLQVDCLVL